MPTNPDPTPPTNGTYGHRRGLILNLEHLHELIHELRHLLGELDDALAGSGPHHAGDEGEEDEEGPEEAAQR